MQDLLLSTESFDSQTQANRKKLRNSVSRYQLFDTKQLNNTLQGKGRIGRRLMIDI